MEEEKLRKDERIRQKLKDLQFDSLQKHMNDIIQLKQDRKADEENMEIEQRLIEKKQKRYQKKMAVLSEKMKTSPSELDSYKHQLDMFVQFHSPLYKKKLTNRYSNVKSKTNTYRQTGKKNTEKKDDEEEPLFSPIKSLQISKKKKKGNKKKKQHAFDITDDDLMSDKRLKQDRKYQIEQLKLIKNFVNQEELINYKKSNPYGRSNVTSNNYESLIFDDSFSKNIQLYGSSSTIPKQRKKKKRSFVKQSPGEKSPASPLFENFVAEQAHGTSNFKIYEPETIFNQKSK